MQAFNITIFENVFVFHTFASRFQHSHIRALLNFFGQEGLRPFKSEDARKFSNV